MSAAILRISGLIGAIAFASLLSAGSASAAVYTHTPTCNVLDMSATANDCFGAILESGNTNDSESLLNENQFGTTASPTGLFGHIDWDLLTKQDTPPESGEPAVTGTDIGLSVTPSGGGTSGSWSVNSGALDLFARVVLILKAGNSFSAYLYEPGSGAGSGGSWSTSSLTNNTNIQNLSHFSIYTSGTVSPVPVPAAVWLFGTALIGFIGFSRRTKV